RMEPLKGLPVVHRQGAIHAANIDRAAQGRANSPKSRSTLGAPWRPIAGPKPRPWRRRAKATVATGGLADCRHSRQRMQVSHADLFDAPQAELPEGFRYRPDLISGDEERVLVEHIAGLPLKEFE